MNLGIHPIQAARVMFGYDAAEDKGRRKPPQKRTLAEAKVLTKPKRKRLQATTQEQIRNSALPAWMLRKHLDYVSKFHFSYRTGNPGLDQLVNRIFRWHGRPENIDFGRRFGRDELFRLFELEKTVAGDAGLLKLDGLKLQAIESDLIAQGAPAPGEKLPEEINAEGLVMGGDGAWIEQYAICNRGDGSKIIFDHLEPAENMIFDGYWTRFSSQRRGISPLSTAINTIQDIHDGLEYNQIKLKMHALFGIALTRSADAATMGGASGVASEVVGGSGTNSQTELDINPTDVTLLDLQPGEDVKAIESATPSSEFVNGTYLFIQIAMLALDFPVTMFDSRRSSFSGRIADLNEYEVSADAKRTKNRYVRQQYSDWVIDEVWNSPEWKLGDVADRNGMTRRDVKEAAEWIPSGSPWLDKLKQIQGDALGIDIGLDNAIDAARRRGGDVFANIDKQKKVIDYARENGVPLVMGKSGARTIEQIIADEISAANEVAQNEVTAP